MKDNKNNKKYKNYDEFENENDLYSVVSSTECTGLIPASPNADKEIDSYSEIYDTTLPRNKKDSENNFKKNKNGKK